MLEVVDSLWTHPAEYRCITTNGIVWNGQLVMGAGVALEAKQKYPQLPAQLGQWVKQYGNRPFICKPEKLITFPTKHHYSNYSDPYLIALSAEHVLAIANKYHIQTVVLPRVGCGCGGLSWGKVKKLIEDILDDRFTVVSER